MISVLQAWYGTYGTLCTAVAYSREMLYPYIRFTEFYFGKGRRNILFNFTWLELRRSEEAQTISTEQ
jgi:hypothetical protein